MTLDPQKQQKLSPLELKCYTVYMYICIEIALCLMYSIHVTLKIVVIAADPISLT